MKAGKYILDLQRWAPSPSAPSPAPSPPSLGARPSSFPFCPVCPGPLAAFRRPPPDPSWACTYETQDFFYSDDCFGASFMIRILIGFDRSSIST